MISLICKLHESGRLTIQYLYSSSTICISRSKNNRMVLEGGFLSLTDDLLSGSISSIMWRTYTCCRHSCRMVWGMNCLFCSNTGIVGLNSAGGMNVCMRFFYVCAVLFAGNGLATGWSHVQGVLPTVYRIKNWKAAKVQERAVEP
jgi:hypothetical protein